MIFSSIEFLFFFLPIVLILYYILPLKAKNVVLLLSSLLFYSWGEPVYVILMILSSIAGYILGLLIDRESKSFKKNLLLCVSVIINLGILGFFKYANFIIDIVNNFGFTIKPLNLALPIGISFFTFQILSYVIDVYKGEIKSEKSLLVLMTYVSMFPQLIAGPIVRFQTVAKQMRKREISFNNYTIGLRRFLMGLFKKVIIANNIGILWESIKGLDMSTLSLGCSWLGAIAFSLQLYFDFSGYGDMAVGMGKILGFDYNENFNYPYIAKSITDFWRRWHISLSTWFRDYVYIPLGGNRKGNLRQIFNILVVWSLTGLWHGAAWNFVLWGVYYGVLLICEKFVWGKFLNKLPALFQHIYTLLIVVTGFAIFALDDFNMLKKYLSVMFLNSNGILFDNEFLFNILNYGFILLIGAIVSAPIYKIIREKNKSNILTVAFYLIGFILSTAYLVNSSYNPFLYFRF
ncbi:MAG: MBOAT family O-acyltransferase [Lachnospirales bacterium]